LGIDAQVPRAAGGASDVEGSVPVNSAVKRKKTEDVPEPAGGGSGESSSQGKADTKAGVIIGFIIFHNGTIGHGGFSGDKTAFIAALGIKASIYVKVKPEKHGNPDPGGCYKPVLTGTCTNGQGEYPVWFDSGKMPFGIKTCDAKNQHENQSSQGKDYFKGIPCGKRSDKDEKTDG